MTDIHKTISPVDGSVYVERPLAGEAEIDGTLDAAVAAQIEWRRMSVADRGAILTRAVDAFVAAKDDIAREITWQMGRPVSQTPGEVAGFEERARHMIAVAEGALADIDVGPKDGFTRFIRRDPLGVKDRHPADRVPGEEPCRSPHAIEIRQDEDPKIQKVLQGPVQNRRRLRDAAEDKARAAQLERVDHVDQEGHAAAADE